MIMYLLMMLTAAVVSYAATWGARLVGNRLELYRPIRSRDMHSTPGLQARRPGHLRRASWWHWSWRANSFFVKDIFRNNTRPGGSWPAPP